MEPAEQELIFDYVILTDLQCILLRYKGILRVEGVMKCCEKLWADPLYDRTYKGLVDLTQVKIDGQASDVPLLAAFYKRPQTSTGRWALVVSEPRITALSLLFKASVLTQPWIELFISWENACAFLNVNLSPAIFAGDSAQDRP